MTLGRLAIWIVNTALFALCCYLAAGLVNAGFGAWLASPPETLAPAPVGPAASSRDWSDRRAILDRNLFQVSTLLPTEPNAAAQPEVRDEDLEATRLPLRLLGTVASTAPGTAWAAVEDQQNRDDLIVRVGDRLLDKATVLRVERRRIVIENDGKREELALDDETDAAPKQAARAPVPSRAASTPAANDLRERIRRLSDSSFQVSRDDVEEAVRNPAELFSEARILPKYENGQMMGVQLSSIKPGSLFEEIGIENGDTVTQVNGVTVTSPQDSAALLRELTEASEFEVSVMGANGQVRSLTYSIGD